MLLTTENGFYLGQIGEALKKELNPIRSLAPVTELTELRKQVSSFAVQKFGVVGKFFKIDKTTLQPSRVVTCEGQVNDITYGNVHNGNPER